MLRLMKTLQELEHACESADDFVACGEKARKYRKDSDGNRITPAVVAALLEQMKEALQNIMMLLRTVKAQLPRKDPEPKP